MRVKRDPQWLEDMAARLRATTEVLRLRDSEIARHAKVKVAAWSNYVNALRPLDIEAAILLCERFELTLDWIYRGDPAGLPHRLATELEQFARRPKAKIVSLKRR